MTEESSAKRWRMPAQRQAFSELLGNRDFRLLLIGQLLSLIGDNCLLVAAIALITDLSDSPLAMLVPALALALPRAIFGLVGGVAADRWNRKWVMVACGVLRALIVLAILGVQTADQLWILSIGAAMLSFVAVFFSPARNAAIPTLVPPQLLLAANSLIQGSTIVALILGPVVAGIAIEIWMPVAVLFDSAVFFASAAIMAMMHLPKVPSEKGAAPAGNSVWHDMRIGLNFIRRNRLLLQVIILTGLTMLGIAAIIMLAIPHLKHQLGASGLEYGLAMSTLGVGAVLGGVVVNRLSRRLSTASTVGGMLLAAGLAIGGFALATSYAMVLASLAGIGLCVVTARGALDTMAQALSTEEVRGRVQSAINLLVATSTAVSQGLAALLGSLFGVQCVFIGAGAVTVIVGLVALFVLRNAKHPVSQELAIGQV